MRPSLSAFRASAWRRRSARMPWMRCRVQPANTACLAQRPSASQPSSASTTATSPLATRRFFKRKSVRLTTNIMVRNPAVPAVLASKSARRKFKSPHGWRPSHANRNDALRTEKPSQDDFDGINLSALLPSLKCRGMNLKNKKRWYCNV